MKMVLPVAIVCGLSLIGVSPANAQHGALGIGMSDNTVGGVLVTNVYAGSPAAQVGLASGDRIMAINKQPVASFRDVTRLIGSSAPNAQVNLDIMRGNWRRTVTATLGAANQVFQAQIASAPAPINSISPAAGPAVIVVPQFQAGGYYNFSPADIDDQHAFGD